MVWIVGLVIINSSLDSFFGSVVPFGGSKHSFSLKLHKYFDGLHGSDWRSTDVFEFGKTCKWFRGLFFMFLKFWRLLWCPYTFGDVMHLSFSPSLWGTWNKSRQRRSIIHHHGTQLLKPKPGRRTHRTSKDVWSLNGGGGGQEQEKLQKPRTGIPTQSSKNKSPPL